MTRSEAVENLRYMISEDCTDTQVDFVEEIEMAIAALEQPTVDAVPVTRCAQCKWCDYPVPNSTKYGCRLFDRCVKGDWFCADGERRTK